MGSFMDFRFIMSAFKREIERNYIRTHDQNISKQILILNVFFFKFLLKIKPSHDKVSIAYKLAFFILIFIVNLFHIIGIQPCCHVFQWRFQLVIF